MTLINASSHPKNSCLWWCRRVLVARFWASCRMLVGQWKGKDCKITYMRVCISVGFMVDFRITHIRWAHCITLLLSLVEVHRWRLLGLYIYIFHWMLRTTWFQFYSGQVRCIYRPSDPCKHCGNDTSRTFQGLPLLK
jgi:hypothetical protein